jgi:hypothetical protein
MKPSFALAFTDDSIGLLHRTTSGWMEVGRIPLDEPDLGQALTYLRGSALGLEPRGLTTKLVIPNSQIRYMVLHAPGPDAASRRAQIKAELEGKTPYAVEDLVFDWRGKGPQVQVAVVARETLAEAEAFAVDNRLNPLSFVANPEPGTFGAEPWFGPTAHAATLLAPGEKVDRDQDPIQIVGRLPRIDGPAEAALPPLEKPADAPPAEEPSEPAIADQVAESPVAEPAQVEAPVSHAEDKGMAEPPAAPWPQEPAPDLAPEPAADLVPPAPAAPKAPLVLATDVTAPSIPDARASDRAQAQAAVRPAVADPRLSKKAPAKAGSSRPAAAEAKRAPAPARLGAPSGGAKGTKSAQEAEWPLERVTTAARARAGQPFGAGGLGAVAAPARDRKPAVVTSTAQPAETASEPRRSSPFAFKEETRGKPRYLGVILTVILLLFLAAVAAWSSFYIASLNDAEEPAVAMLPAEPMPAEPLPEPDAEPAAELAPASQPEVPEPAGTTAPPPRPDTISAEVISAEAIAPVEDAPAVAEAEPAEVTPEPVEPAVETATVAEAEPAEVTPEPAEPAVETATVAQPEPVTATSRNPPEVLQDEIFLAMIDPRVATSDAVALTAPVIANDPLPPLQPAPPPFGTFYQFDADGRILPTPEGIVTPDGVLLVAGRPPVVPPQRPAALTVAPVEPAPAEPVQIAPVEAAQPAFADPALAGARPRLRPEGLAPDPAPAAAPTADDDAALAAAPDTRLSSLVPRARPPEMLAQGEAQLAAETAAVQSASASLVASAGAGGDSLLAVSVSRKPAPRPQDFNRAIEAAVSVAAADASLMRDTTALVPDAPQRAPQPEADDPAVIEEDEPEVVSAAPSIPTRASVAKQATFTRAINLSKVNLIGIYGTSSNRHAMVRQANGRFVKVEVGDRIDGGRVAAISDRQLQYIKNGRTVTLAMPKG